MKAPRVAIVLDEYLAWLVSGRHPTGIPRFTEGLLAAGQHSTLAISNVVSAIDPVDHSRVTLLEISPRALTTRRDGHPAPAREILSTIRQAVVLFRLPRDLRNRMRDLYLRLAVRSFKFEPGPAIDAATIILPSWNALPLWRVRLLAASGARLRLVVHDLFPITNPEWFPPQFILTFRESMDAIVPRCERLVALTPEVAASLETVYPVTLGRIRVGTPTLEIGKRSRSKERPGSKSPVAGDYFLSLCTVEPRKNLAVVLAAWEIAKLDPRVAKLQLVIAGQRGWLSNNLEAQVRREASRLDIVRLPRADDDLADSLYEGCLATIHASWAEGYGIPVRESIARGIRTLISSAIPRGGLPDGSYAVFDPASASELAALMVASAVAGRARETVQLGEGNGWEPVLEALVADS